MSTRTADELIQAIEHLPDSATLVIYGVSWEDYECVLDYLQDRSRCRVSYDQGRLEIMSSSPEHENSGRFIDALVQAFCDARDLLLENYGSTTWKRQRLAQGVEPDSCYYVANAFRVVGKREFDLEVDPPPDVVLEIDITHDSFSKFPIYAALRVPEIWDYDGRTMRFHELTGDNYREISHSLFPGLTPALLAQALEQNKTDGRTAALRAFRQRVSV
jgi:Uma2 family endonuclease